MNGWMGAALRDGWFWLLGLLVAWWVSWFGRVVAWLVGLLVGTPLMDAWMDGCCVNGEGAAPPPQCKPSLPRTGFLVSTALGENTELCGLVAWLVCWLGRVVAWLVGRLVGTPLMDGWMDGSCAASRSGGVRVTFRRFPSFRTVSAQFPEGSEGLATRSY